MSREETLDFGILGPIQVRKDGAPLALGGPKPRAVLADLLLHANQTISVDKLIDDLWGGSPPATAQTALQVYVMQLRRLLEPGHGKGKAYDVIVTAPPGYAIRVAPDALDLARFERLAGEGAQALATADPQTASERFGGALALWRGSPLADVAYESFAQASIARLEELRLAILERRIEADLACGRHPEVVAELQALCSEHPLREVLTSHLMLALYRCGRQAEALELYHRARARLVDELGIDPGHALQRLEREILMQDPALDLAASAGEADRARSAAPDRAVVVVAGEEDDPDDLIALAESLSGAAHPHELIVARVLDPSRAEELASVSEDLRARCDGLAERGVVTRIAAFTSRSRADDIQRLAARSEVDLLMLDAGRSVFADGVLDQPVVDLLENALCDVCLLLRPGGRDDRTWLAGPLLVPFGGAIHDWAALELAAWIAAATDRPLHMLGTAAAEGAESRDASRLLADAGLLIQRASSVRPIARLVGAGRDGTVQAAKEGGLLVMGLSERWREEGLGMTRWAIARSVHSPLVFVRRGVRPGGLAPDETFTRFGWSVTVGG